MPLNKISFLELTNFPLTNQEAEIFKNAGWFKKSASQSHFYMICSRPIVNLAHVSNPKLQKQSNAEMFEISSGDMKDRFILNPEQVPHIAKLADDAQYYLGVEGEIIFLSKKKNPSVNSDVYDNWTVRKILWEKSRGVPWLIGLDNYRKYLTYNLLYVGIAPLTNTLERLIIKGHHARQKILSNEYPIEYGVRVTDEVHILMFDVNPLFVQKFDENEELSDVFVSGVYEENPIIKDAEKAFVSLLRPKYNVERYDKYPISSDGLYDEGFDGYSYSIAENITLRSPSGEFNGGFSRSSYFSDEADCIQVEGKMVRIIKSKS